MMTYTSLLCIFICTLSYIADETAAAEITVGIIGGGIGGRTTAAFLKEALGDQAEIHVYDPSSIGGRTTTAKDGGLTLQTARTFLHNTHKHLNYFVNKFRIQTTPQEVDEKTAVFNGDSLNVLLKYQSRVKYGADFEKLSKFVETNLNEFVKIYDLQNQNKAFETVKDLLNALNPELFEFTKTSAAQVLKNKAKVGDSIINDYAEARLRSRYAQSVTNSQGFAGLISLTEITGRFRSVNESSVSLMDRILKYSGAKMHNKFVQEVKKVGNKIAISSSKTADGKSPTQNEYDFVVVALPLGENVRRMTFTGFANPIPSGGKFHKQTTHLLKGSLKAGYFKSNAQTVNGLDRIINVKDKNFDTLSRNYPICGSSNYYQFAGKYYKLSYTGDLQQAKRNELFEGPVTLIKESPKIPNSPEYDDFTQAEKATFVLSDKLYHVNAIEWAAGGIEMTSIAGKNVALLIRNKVRR